MRVPLGWLRDYVDLDLSPEALAERLTLLGFEVKGLERWGSDWRNVVVGELLTVEKHPRADRLSLTTVRVGAGEPLGKRFWTKLEIHVVAQPAQGDSHRNCSRKRRSLSRKIRTSPIP